MCSFSLPDATSTAWLLKGMVDGTTRAGGSVELHMVGLGMGYWCLKMFEDWRTVKRTHGNLKWSQTTSCWSFFVGHGHLQELLTTAFAAIAGDYHLENAQDWPLERILSTFCWRSAGKRVDGCLWPQAMTNAGSLSSKPIHDLNRSNYCNVPFFSKNTEELRSSCYVTFRRSCSWLHLEDHDRKNRWREFLLCYLFSLSKNIYQ